MEKLIKKYQKKFSKAIVTQHTDTSIKISWNFGSFAVINVDDKGTETLHFAFDKGLIKLGLDNILNHFNAQDEQTDITDKFRNTDGSLPTVEQFNQFNIGGDISIK